MLSDRNPLVISRQLLGLFAAEIGRLSPDVLKVRASRRASAAACARPASTPRAACLPVAALRARQQACTCRGNLTRCATAQDVAAFALEKIQPRVVSFEEQVCATAPLRRVAHVCLRAPGR